MVSERLVAKRMVLKRVSHPKTGIGKIYGKKLAKKSADTRVLLQALVPPTSYEYEIAGISANK